jgi:HK97 family phage prohead protease
METKFFQLDLKADEAGVVEGYGSVFGNRDSYGDIVEPGAFAATIRNRKPKMLWQHNMADVIGVWDEVREDERGLYVKGRLLKEVQKAREAEALLRAGAIDGLSIGFRTVKDEIEGAVRKLKEIDLYEVSFVTMPANAEATVTNIRSMSDAPEVERAVRAALGLSRKEAKAFMARGMAGLLDLRDAGEDAPDANQRDVEAVKTQLQQLLERVAR